MGCGASKKRAEEPATASAAAPEVKIEGKAEGETPAPAEASGTPAEAPAETSGTAGETAAPAEIWAPPETSDWSTLYGVLGCFSNNDQVRALELVNLEGAEQMRTEPKAPGWTVLGNTGEKVMWIAYFDDKDAYHIDHKESQDQEKNPDRKNYIPELFSLKLHENFMQNMAGGYMGNLNVFAKPDSEPSFAVWTTYKCKDTDTRAKLVDMMTSEFPKQESLCRAVFVVAPGDTPVPDDLSAMSVECWPSKGDWEANGKKWSECNQVKALLIDEVVGDEETDPAKPCSVVEFDGTVKHYKK